MNTRIIQHCFGKPASGGPIVALERLLAHSSVPYGVIRQTEPAGGLNVALIRRFVRELRQQQPQLVHVRGLGNEGFHAALAARLAGVPKILVSVHGTQRDLRHPGNPLRHWVVKSILEPLTLVMATHVATVCEFAAQRSFIRPFIGKLVGVVPNGVELPNLSRPEEPDFRARWGIPADLPLAVCVSRITEEKGYLTLASALRILDAECRLALLVVGGGDESKHIRNQFSGLANIVVRFVGHQHDVGSFLAASDLFLFPSLHENLSNALIEAMAHGLPAIATDVGGNTEVVARGGGILVPPGNAIELATAIARLLREPDFCMELAQQARENIRAHYSVERMVSDWQGLYERILKDDHGRA
nr:glycosyltransferase family 4 protein [Aromatoleum aromaticum]